MVVPAGPTPAGDWRRELQSPMLPFANARHLAALRYHVPNVLLYIHYNTFAIGIAKFRNAPIRGSGRASWCEQLTLPIRK